MINILSNENVDLHSLHKNNHSKYLKNEPFSHIVFDNFFNNEFLEEVLEDFPKDLNKAGIEYNNKTEKKNASADPGKNSVKTKHLINYLNSYEFINFLNNLTGIKEKLIPDPYLWGGGFHELKNEGFLNIHSDFNVHPELKLNRRINLLIYLNKDWQENYGGSLELWDKKMKHCVKRINPIFNRVVIFNTNDFSFHGNPEKINHPKKISRKSIALYYYSNGRPSNEIKNVISQSTIFQRRPNTNDEKSKTVTYKKLFGKFYVKKKIIL